MSVVSLTSGGRILRDAAAEFFRGRYENPEIKVDESLHPSIGWTPDLQFRATSRLIIAVEVSEDTANPLTLGHIGAQVRQYHAPIAVYTVCPQECILTPKGLKDADNLRSQGFGLLVVDANGATSVSFSANPLIQHIPDNRDSEIDQLFKKLPKTIRVEAKEAFERYKANAQSGVQAIGEICEGLSRQAAKEAAKKGWVSGQGTVGLVLNRMAASTSCQNAAPAIGGMASYISTYRNCYAHYPSSLKAAHKKYVDCRHAFLEGVRKMIEFREGIRKIGLSGRLPRTQDVLKNASK